MTEFELLILQDSYSDSTSTFIMNFISILSGYLLANHFLGSRINRAQFIIMTLTYTFILFLTTYAIYTNIIQFHQVEASLVALDRTWESAQKSGEIMTAPVLISLLITYIGSLYFSFTSRKQHGELLLQPNYDTAESGTQTP